MKAFGFVFTVILLGLGAAALLRAASQAAPAKVSEELLKAKVDAARRTYEVVWKNNKEALIPFVELAYRWSRRWLEADIELKDGKADRVAVYQAHLDRMRTLERITQDRHRNRVNTIEEVTAAEFYAAEARIWLEQSLAANR